MSKKPYNKYRNEFTDRSAKIPWKYYKAILEEYGATERKRSHSGGSKRSFVLGNSVFVIHKPHIKDQPVGKWDHHNVLELLYSQGLIQDED